MPVPILIHVINILAHVILPIFPPGPSPLVVSVTSLGPWGAGANVTSGCRCRSSKPLSSCPPASGSDTGAPGQKSPKYRPQQSLIIGNIERAQPYRRDKNKGLRPLGYQGEAPTDIWAKDIMETCTAYYNYTFRFIDDFIYQLTLQCIFSAVKGCRQVVGHQNRMAIL